jgi:hypothetical protein
MKIKLTESKLKQIVDESVKKVLNEVTVDGVKLNGNNAYDWAEEIGPLRGQRIVTAAENFKNALITQNGTQIKSAFDTLKKEIQKYEQTMNTARGLGYEDGTSRHDKSMSLMRNILGAKTPEEKQKYTRELSGVEGDYMGRADRDIRRLQNANIAAQKLGHKF